MTVKELQSVLCGTVTLYEAVPGADISCLSLAGIWYKDLYTGMSQKIPKEFVQRKVLLACPGRGERSGRIEIKLKPEAGNAGRRAGEKVHEKSPA